MDNNGWIGIARQLTYFLSIVGADKDEDGRYLIGNGSVTSFMGVGGENADVVVDGEAVYFVDGRQCNLAAGLRGTSYGMGVKVF
jgi:hypothetical protein